MAIKFNGNDIISSSNFGYATCSTAAATVAKVATVQDNPNWQLKSGSIIVVSSTNTNTAQNPTLNVNETGAKSVYYASSTITTSNLNKAGCAGRPILYMYNGTYYVFLGWAYEQDTTYSTFTKSGSSAKSGLVPAPSKTAGTTKYLREDGTWTVPPDTNTTYSNFVKSGSGAKAGLVPAPSTTAGTTKYLREDGTWTVPPDTNTTYSKATSSALGLVKIGYTESGKNYPVELNSSGQMYVNVPWTDNNTTYSVATTSANGLMSSAMVTKLNGIATGANAYSLPTASSATKGGVTLSASTSSTSGTSSGIAATPSAVKDVMDALNAEKAMKPVLTDVVSPVTWYKSHGFVFCFANGLSGSYFYDIPSGYRPPETVWLPVCIMNKSSSWYNGWMGIKTNGTIVIQATATHGSTSWTNCKTSDYKIHGFLCYYVG